MTLTSRNHWDPSCSIELLRARALLYAELRRFFLDRGVLEVETPLLGRFGVTDPAIHPFITHFKLPGHKDSETLYLQTSPEYAMKRLLASGSGSIYQICKAFRNEELGRHHNPEFTLLEWYRTDFDLMDLIQEVEALFSSLFETKPHWEAPQRFSYAEIFHQYLGLDPFTATIRELEASARKQGLLEAAALCGEDRSVWLDLLFSYYIQPNLGHNRLTSIYHYPAFMPSLARKSLNQPECVARVELFVAGVELGNGFYELSDPIEQRKRFERDLEERERQGLPAHRIDDRLLSALETGLPDCSGIAIGLDRLLLLLTDQEALADILAFPMDRA
jgi:lysyl-tRNA synthetase class 2